MNLIDQVYDVNNLKGYLHILKDKNFLSPKLYKTEKTGINLSDILSDSSNFAQAIIKDFKNKKFHFGHALIKTIKVKDKERIIYQFDLIDTVIGGYLAWSMSNVMETFLTENVFSYRKGLSFWQAINKLSNYTLEHKRKISEPKKRGLYVLRRDIKSYTDTIPVYENSPLWEKIKNTFFKHQNDTYLFGLYKELIRPIVHDKNHVEWCNLLGIPTGQPITATLYNFYAFEIDQYFTLYPEIFYLRYSDDLIIASPDKKNTEKTKIELNEILLKLKLKFKDSKNGDFYFNGAAKKDDQDSQYQGVDQVDFLGCSVKFDGTIRLKSNRQKRILNIARKRVKNIKENNKDLEKEKLGKLLSHHINNIFWNKKTQVPIKSIDMLKKMVNDRTQLKEIDYALALIIAENVSQVKGVKAFRQISYEKIRNEWGLKSFVQMRNLYGN